MGRVAEQLATPFQALTQEARRLTERIPEQFDVGLVELGKDVLQFGREPNRPGRERLLAAAQAASDITDRLRGREPTEPLPPDFPPLLESPAGLAEAEREEPGLAQVVGGAATDPTLLIPGVGIPRAATSAGTRIAAERAALLAGRRTAGEGIELLGRPVTRRVAGGADELTPVGSAADQLPEPFIREELSH